MVELTPFYRRTALVSGALLLAALACRQAPPKPAISQAGGETVAPLPETWAPERLSMVRGIAVANVRASIKASLDSVKSRSLSKETVEHARRLYGEYSGGPLWFKSNGLDHERVGFLMRALANGDADALNLGDYPLGELADAVNASEGKGAVTADQLARADFFLTAAYAALGEDLLTGQIDPKTVLQSWHIDPQEEKVDSALARTLRSEPLDQAIATMGPLEEGYIALRTELAHYRALASKGDWPTVPTGKLLKPGEVESSDRLAAVRARLAVEGMLSDSGSTASPSQSDSAGAARKNPHASTVRYDRALAGAVARFQARHNIPVDSALGPETVASMNIPVTYRLGQIAANMERYRWLPRTLGSRYILVNVPAFQLQAFDSSRKVLEMKVIVGMEYEGKATPVFSDTMQFVVFRPYWNITDEIAATETWPKAKADPNYMAANNLETYIDGGKTHIRQLPGDHNSLGLVKFIFPNDYNIYLHDTPEGELFNKDVRAFSHGCIRLEHPDKLAEFVLGWSADQVQSAMHGTSDNHRVNLPRSIPVYIAYFTTYVRDSTLFFGNDLYKRDDALMVATAGGAIPSPAAIKAAAALRKMAEDWTK